MNILVSQEIASVCPGFVGAAVDARVHNTPYSAELWQEIHALDASKAQLQQIRHMKSFRARAGAQGVGPRVAEIRRVRQRPHAEGVQDDQKYTLHAITSRVHYKRKRPARQSVGGKMIYNAPHLW